MATFDYLLRHTCCRPYANHVTVVAVKRFSHCVPTFVSIAWTSLMPSYTLKVAKQRIIRIYIYIFSASVHEINRGNETICNVNCFRIPRSEMEKRANKWATSMDSRAHFSSWSRGYLSSCRCRAIISSLNDKRCSFFSFFFFPFYASLHMLVRWLNCYAFCQIYGISYIGTVSRYRGLLLSVFAKLFAEDLHLSFERNIFDAWCR